MTAGSAVLRSTCRIAFLAAAATAAFLSPHDLAAAQYSEYVDVDDAGRIVRFVDPSGLETKFSYDARDRLYEVRSPYGSARFGYDLDGRHSWTEDKVGTVEYSYDALNRLRSAKYSVTHEGEILFTREVHYAYDDFGAVQRVELAGGGRMADLQVELYRDARGRLRTAQYGQMQISFERRENPEGTETIRTLPNGTISTFQDDSADFPLSIAHRAAGRARPFRQSQVDFAFADAEIRVRQETAVAVEDYAIDMLDDSMSRVEMRSEAYMRMSADGRIVERTIGTETRWFLIAPVGVEGGLIAELDSGGDLQYSFFSARHLIVEQAASERPVFFLETPGVSGTLPAEYRIATGRSLTEWAGGGPASSPETFSLPEHFATIGGVAENVGGRTGFGFEAVDKFSKLRSMRAYGFDPIGPTLLPGQVEVAEVFNVVEAIGADLRGILNQDTTLEDKLRRNFFAGKLSEHYATEYFKKRMQSGTGKALVGEGVLLTYTLLRGHGLRSPEAVDHYVDAGIYIALRIVGAAAPPGVGEAYANFVVTLGKQLRSETKEEFIRMGEVWGRTGEGQTGNFVYQGAYALLAGDIERFRATNPSIFFTVAGGRQERIRSAYGSRRQRAFEDFERALFSGNRRKVARMLREDQYIRRELRQAGHDPSDIEAVARGVEDRRGQRAVPGTDAAEVAPRLGGVDLGFDETALPSIGSIEAAYVDPETGGVVLIGDGDRTVPGIDPELFAVALIAAYDGAGHRLRFSLDPVDPSDPNSWQKAVYLPENLLAGTKFGQVMYQADLDLKLLAFGAERSYGAWREISSGGTRVDVPVEVWLSNSFRPIELGARPPLWPGFQSVPELRFAQREATAELIRARQWITIDEVAVEDVGDALVFDTLRLGVKARRQAIDARGQLVDIATEDAVANAFALQLTRGFDLAAEKVPTFSAIREAAKAVVLAEWLARNGVEVDLDWAVDLVNRRRDSVREVSTLRWVHEREDQTWFDQGSRHGIRTTRHSIEVSGGVDLTNEPKWLPGDKTARALRDQVAVAYRAGAGPVFAVGAREATVLPVNGTGRAAWIGFRQRQADGLVYTTDAAGRLVRSEDAFGHRERYSWSADGDLAAVTTVSPNGNVRTVTRDGSEIRLQNRSHAGQRLEWLARPGERTLLVDGEIEFHLSPSGNGSGLILDFPRAQVAREIRLDQTRDSFSLLRHQRGVAADLEHVELAVASPGDLRSPHSHQFVEIGDGERAEVLFDRGGRINRLDAGRIGNFSDALDPAAGRGMATLGSKRLTMSRPVDGVTRIALEHAL